MEFLEVLRRARFLGHAKREDGHLNRTALKHQIPIDHMQRFFSPFLDKRHYLYYRKIKNHVSFARVSRICCRNTEQLVRAIKTSMVHVGSVSYLI